MALSTLDKNAALIVIDLQKGTVGMGAPGAAEVVSRAAELARAFRERKLPVVLVNVAGRAPGRTDASFPAAAFPPDWTELTPELEAQESDLRVTKHHFGAFGQTDLHQQLQERGVTQVFIAGISTSIGVESTARAAYDLGYNVVLVTDATADRDPTTHEHSVEKVFPRLGERATTAEVLRILR
jgi:nicotinamidase-related amidase